MAIFSWLGRIVVEVIIGKMVELVKNAYLKWKRRKEISDEAKASVKPLKEAQTAEEIDSATDNALDGF